MRLSDLNARHGSGRYLGLFIVVLLLVGCFSARGRRGTEPARKSPTVKAGYTEKGIASWYGPGFDGRQTANGETYDMWAMTAAHKTLPFDSMVEVHNLDNGQRTTVRINDRGPFIRGRIIDLSRAGAEAIEMVGPGVARVKIRVVSGPATSRTARAPRGGSFQVQAGAFRDPVRARGLVRALEQDYPGARVRSHDGWHRVEIGPFDDRGEAERAVRDLRQYGVEAVVKQG